MAVREAWVYADSLLSRHVPLRPPRWGLRMTCLVLGTVLVVTIIIVVQSLSRVPLFATPWAAAHQASLSFTISGSLLRLTSIESVMPSNHLTLSHPLLLLPSVFPSFRVFFQWVSSLHQVAKVFKSLSTALWKQRTTWCWILFIRNLGGLLQ